MASNCFLWGVADLIDLMRKSVVMMVTIVREMSLVLNIRAIWMYARYLTELFKF